MTSKLSVVGTGIKALKHITSEVKDEIKNSDIVYFLVADPLTPVWLREINCNIESLHSYYSERKSRAETYEEIVVTVIKSLEFNDNVCLVSYGHPGVFAYPMHESVRRAKAIGHKAKMFPNISAEDCLFADLGVDPGLSGCQSYEATDFLLYKRKFDIHSSLILWQIGVIGIQNYVDSIHVWNRKGLEILTQYLLDFYPSNHSITVYEAAIFSFTEPKIIETDLSDLSSAQISAISTLYIPPLQNVKPDVKMLQMLQMSL